MTNNGIFIANAKNGTQSFVEYTNEEQAIQDTKMHSLIMQKLNFVG